MNTRKIVLWHRARLGALLLLAIGFAACGPVRLTVKSNIPEPLIAKMPVGVALYVPTEFSQYVHKEERSGTKWEIAIGEAQTQTMTRLINAMFERVIPVDSVNSGATHASEIRAILEPSVEEFAFVTPRDAGSPYFAVSIKYRVNVYSPDGKLADSWGFTGYGTAAAEGVVMEDPLLQAASLAMRDAGAKLAVEFREQPMVRDLLPDAASADSSPAPPPTAPAAASPPAETTPPQQETSSPETSTPAAPAPAPASEEKPSETTAPVDKPTT